MKVEFYDYGVDKKPSRTFESADELGAFLESLRTESMMCELKGENDFKLSIGIDGDIGCAQHSSMDDEPPYLVAVSPVMVVADNHEFFLTGHSTEVSKENCLSFAMLKDICCHFLVTGERSSLVEWVDA